MNLKFYDTIVFITVLLRDLHAFGIAWQVNIRIKMYLFLHCLWTCSSLISGYNFFAMPSIESFPYII